MTNTDHAKHQAEANATVCEGIGGPKVDPVVTDAMVEAALDKLKGKRWRSYAKDIADDWRVAMRAAITAALAVKAEGGAS